MSMTKGLCYKVPCNVWLTSIEAATSRRGLWTVRPPRQNIWILIQVFKRNHCIYNVFPTIVCADVSELKSLIPDPSTVEESEKYLRNYYCSTMCYMLQGRKSRGMVLNVGSRAKAGLQRKWPESEGCVGINQDKSWASILLNSGNYQSLLPMFWRLPTSWTDLWFEPLNNLLWNTFLNSCSSYD